MKELKCVLIIKKSVLNPNQDRPFRGCSQVEGWGGKKAPIPKIFHTC